MCVILEHRHYLSLKPHVVLDFHNKLTKWCLRAFKCFACLCTIQNFVLCNFLSFSVCLGAGWFHSDWAVTHHHSWKMLCLTWSLKQFFLPWVSFDQLSGGGGGGGGDRGELGKPAWGEQLLVPDVTLDLNTELPGLCLGLLCMSFVSF